MVDSLDSTDGVEIWNWLYKPSNSSYQMDVLSSPEQDKQVTVNKFDQHYVILCFDHILI